jgi:hypothetical protein
MSKPTIIFLRNGLISVMAALAVWLLPFMLRDAGKRPQGPKEVGAGDGQDLLKELDVAITVPPKTANRPQSADVEPQPQIRSQYRLQPQQKAPEPQHQAVLQSRPQPQPAPVPLPQARLQPPPQLQANSEPQWQPGYQPEPKTNARPRREDPTPSASPQPGTEASPEPAPAAPPFADRLRRAVLEDVYAPTPSPLPQVAYAAPLPRVEPAAVAPVTLAALTPPLPARHPNRMSFLDELPGNAQPRPIQAAVIHVEPKPRARPATFMGYLSTLWRGNETSAQPAARQATPGAAVNGTRVATAPANPAAGYAASPRPAQPLVPGTGGERRRGAAAQWTPSACSDGDDFWK